MQVETLGVSHAASVHSDDPQMQGHGVVHGRV